MDLEVLGDDGLSMAEALGMSNEEFDKCVSKVKFSPDYIKTGTFSETTITEATKILRHAFLTDNDLYNGLVASIESALRESKVVWEEWEYTETARKVADRIVGIEK